MKNEIVLYQADGISTSFEVMVVNDTVWLNRKQLALLFERDIKTIGKHIGNALKEELEGFSVVAKFATTAKDGKVYKVDYYNLDMIISIGYRVKSRRGIQFRIWANSVLKDYLLKGYAVSQRIDRVERNLNKLNEKFREIDLRINTGQEPTQGIFYDGQVFDAYLFASNVIKSAKSSIVLIDSYIDETVLSLLRKRQTNVAATIYTSKLDRHIQLDINKHNAQYSAIEIREFRKSHDRFLIIDGTIVYHIGASLKDLGKKWFAFSKIHIDPQEMLERL